MATDQQYGHLILLGKAEDHSVVATEMNDAKLFQAIATQSIVGCRATGFFEPLLGVLDSTLQVGAEISKVFRADRCAPNVEFR